MTAGDDWARFIEEGRALVAALDEAVHAPALPESAETAREALGALELDARVLEMTELAQLCVAIRRVVDRHARAPAGSALVDADLRLTDSVRVLTETFEQLARPDRSGAQIDAVKLASAADALASRDSVPPPSRASARPPPLAAAPGGAGAGADDTRWEPTVDEDMIDPFLEECQERLEGLASKLVELERAPGDTELIRAIFRDLHTLKGSSAFVGLRKMTRLAHAAEDLVGYVRDGKRPADSALVDALLSTLDVLTAIVRRATARGEIDVDISAALVRLGAAPVALAAPSIRLPSPTIPPAAMPDAEHVPGAAQPAPRVADVAAARAAQTLRIDFEKLDLLMNLVGELVLAKGRLAVGLDGIGSLAREIDAQRRHAVLTGRQTARVAAGGAHPRSRTGGVRSQDVATELGRIQRAFDLLEQELDAASQQLDVVSGELRDQVMKLRMVPIGRTWSKYHRTVREIANGLGKRVRLELAGADTELDKVLVEQLDDPFLHLVRNAIDHGIESPADRTAAGKAPEGLLRLSAFHRGNQIVIRVEDDGGGIDVDRVRAKAIEKGILDEASTQSLDDDAVFDLIFRPGFSTAQKVSDLSGRGVGMDVVRETIGRLKGSVTVSSRPGKGSTFEVRLPLTLAIIQVLIVRCGGELYAIPIDLVTRTVAAPPAAIRSIGDREVLLEGERDVPLIRLQEVLALPDGTADAGPDTPVVLVDLSGETFGLACHGFVGRQEIVIKPLGTVLQEVEGAAGATLIGDRCVLILDVPTVVSLALQQPRAATGAARPQLSVVRDAAVHPRGQPPRPSQLPPRPRILVAEDADVIREAIRRTLETAGYEVVVARDGAEAIAIAMRERFDLVSTDVIMPEVDGYELTRRLRETEAYKDVPIVMVTSKGERIDKIRGFDAGVDAYLTKPTDATELLRVIARYLSAR